MVANWEQIKKAEKGRASVFDGVPAALPALLYALKVQKKAASLELDPSVALGPTGSDAGADEMSDADFAQGLGDVLWAVVDRARRLGVDPEDALRAATVAQLARLRALEVDQG